MGLWDRTPGVPAYGPTGTIGSVLAVTVALGVLTGCLGRGRAARLGLRHGDPCRTDDPVTDLVPRLQNLHARLAGMDFGRVDTVFTASGIFVLLAGLYAMVALPAGGPVQEPEPEPEPPGSATAAA